MKLTTSVATPLFVATAIAAGAQGSPTVPLPGERAATVTAIPGIVAADAKWELVWASFLTADGIVGTPDGGVLFAQEQSDTIRKLDAAGKEYIFVKNTHGAGSVSLDAEGRLFAVQRACTDTARPFSAACQELTAVGLLYPERKTLANGFADGRPFGRPNDVMSDGKGGAYFTMGGAFHVSAGGVVSVVADQNIRSNGIMLSPDGKTLYVTNQKLILAFDVRADGTTQNRRDFALLADDEGGDGMAVDSVGRLYVTANRGIHVFSPQGQHLGLIPTPRRPISLAFSGPDKKTLYVPQMGAVGPDGTAWTTPEGVRNAAMTIYRIQMQAEGFKGRPK